LEEDSRNGTSLSAGALLWEPGGGGYFAGDPEGYVEERSGDRHPSPWGPHWKAWKGVHLPGIYVLKKALETSISLRIEAPLGTWGHPFTWNSERALETEHLFMGALLGEPGGVAPLLGTMNDM
jgi:hypothetical protein